MSQPTSQPPTDPRALRNALGRFATGIAVVTAIDPDGHPIGLTVNSFSAVSLQPALVLWCLDNRSVNLEAFRKASHHAINILAADQQDISNRFATWPTDRFAGLDWQAGIGGAPVIAGSCASFEVFNETAHPGGDHTIFVGRVERFSENADAAPLLFHAGQYRLLAARQAD
ncbi:flavin reductase family protein [Azonexus sp. R2A61]|uniref:flavin reductase family protein n=1 Tax=Azonexus sp. R2A61 TaxID=2744443 RepID=UPI001F48A7A9|nr:flavin reductase family protein [Azonexus sp. R2A61]